MKRQFVLAAAALAVLAASSCAVSPGARPEADTWAFCGVHPDDPTASTKVFTLSRQAGIDATFGPCLPPDWATYTPADPGARYTDPATYARLVDLNALVGMTTVVYDARVWSTDPTVRAEAVEFWQSRTRWVEAWDMGDEYDPDGPHWPILVDRWHIVLEHVTPATGVRPFTNHLWWSLDQALADLPGQADHMSFDLYEIPESLAVAERFAGRTANLMCAINALDHGPYRLSAYGIETQMLDHRDAGCDTFLIFGGVNPYDTPGFDLPSLVNDDGSATRYAHAVLRGAR